MYEQVQAPNGLSLRRKQDYADYRVLYIVSLVLLLVCLSVSAYFSGLKKGDLLVKATLQAPIELVKTSKGGRHIEFVLNEYDDIKFIIMGVNFSAINNDFLYVKAETSLELLVNKKEFESKTVNNLFYISDGNRIYLTREGYSYAIQSHFLILIVFSAFLLVYQIHLYYKERRDSLKREFKLTNAFRISKEY